MLDGLTSRFAAGLRSPLGGVVVPGEVIPTVTVTRAPSLNAVAAGDTLADALDAGAYTAPAGGSLGTLVAAWEVDGSIVGGTPTQAEDDVLRARITVNYTDGEAVARAQVFWTNAVTVTAAANTAPVAVDDTLTVAYETAGTVDVLANDTDADDDTLSVTSASSPDGTVSIGAAPGYILTFTPDDAFDGTTTITYTVDDGNGGTDTGTVNVTVTAAATGTAQDVTTTVGAQTLSGVAIETLKTDTDGPLTGVSATGGTASGTNYALSASGVLTVASDGSLSGEDGNTITFTSDQGTGTITLDVDDTKLYNYTVSSQANFTAAFIKTFSDHSYLAAGDAQIIFKDGNYTTSSTTWKNRPFVNELVLRSENPKGAAFTTEQDIYNCDNLTYQDFRIEANVLMQFGSVHISFMDCDVVGPGVLTAVDAYDGVNGPGVTGIWGLGSCGDVNIIRCDIHGWGNGIVCGELIGQITIIGNKVTNIYEDSIKLGGGHPVTVKYNYIEGSIAGPTALNSTGTLAHADTFQFLGNGTADWENIEIIGNIFTTIFSDRSNQMVFLKGMSGGYCFSGTKINGNIVVNRGSDTTGIRVHNARDLQAIGNTVVSHLGGTAFGPGILIGEDDTFGTHDVRNNAADRITVYGTSNVIADDNTLLGIGGATIPYTTAFAGTGFDPVTRAEVLSMFGMKANGPLDVDDSGDASVGDRGAVGSGYVTFPATNPGSDGSLDTDYEGTEPDDGYTAQGSELLRIPLGLTTCWTDSVGGTLAGVGDDVAWVTNPHDASNHFQLKSTVKPKLRQDSEGMYYLELLGAQGTSITLPFTGKELTIIIALRASNATSSVVYELGDPYYYNTAGGVFMYSDAGVASFSTSNQTGTGTGFSKFLTTQSLTPIAKVFTQTVDFAATTAVDTQPLIRTDGADVKPANTGTYTFTATDVSTVDLNLFARGGAGGTLGLSAKFYGLIAFDDALDATEAATAEAWLEGRTPDTAV